MKKRFIIAIKYIAPIVTIILATIQLTNTPFPKWLGISLLFLTAILYTVALIFEKSSRHKK